MSEKMIYDTDFDGTAVEKITYGFDRIKGIRNVRGAGKYAVDLCRNMAKYPLAGRTNFGHFVRGVRDSGIEPGNVVTRRPDIGQRHVVTRWSLLDNGLEAFFDPRNDIVYAGSEMGKAVHVARRASTRPVLFTDDRPHGFGSELLGVLTKGTAEMLFTERQIVIGAVEGPKTYEYIDRLAERIPTISKDITWTEAPNGGLHIEGDAFAVDVVKVNPYLADMRESYQAGRDFGNHALRLCGIEELVA